MSDDLTTIYSERIRDMRQARGMSLRELGARAGITPSYAHDIENGRREPSLTTFIAIARALGCSAAYLLGESESAK